MTVTTRRTANTETIHHLWDAIVYARQQRQIANIERISSYMRRKHNITPEDLEQQLERAMRDSLIEMKRSVGCKGSKAGIEQDSYRIPEKDAAKDGHDWYCFTCHKGGEVLYCSTCHRVYHADCLTEPPVQSDKLICEACKLIKTKDGLKINKDDLNLLLGYACLRMKEKVTSNRELLKIAPSEEEKWRHNFLIYETMDLTIMEDKTQENVYKRLEEFQADAQTLVHNIVLYYGVHSSAADTARQMLRDCCYDLNEIKQCRDCYRTSNEKREKYWFCQPCDPPHELVYAKQKVILFWPAKVIRVNNGIYDVRFFGGLHQRANVEKENVKPITTSIQQLQLKRSATLNKALEELKRHQQLLGQIPKEKKAKKQPSRPSSANSSRSNSASRSRSRKGSVSSDEDISENEAEDDNSSQDECPTSSSPKIPRFKDAPTPEDHNVVSSSCQESSPVQKSRAERRKERSLRELAERLHQDFEDEKQRVVATAIEKVTLELSEAKRNSEDQLQSTHQIELTELVERHRLELSETKKKQWCYNCEAEAIYHCCWNTSYCSVDCQQVHWHKEHKSVPPCRKAVMLQRLFVL
ncbi:zinc finger MYND domain-containing protein 11 [Caerostris extrusa]|uniref:Zinc finger MYND domain-containing protein 11 n=1 Tax=Caerostris extrusa TaxID=172846 RepID=A0AAV4XKJ4_CAEEX|nr:zinc finger MYND domain-containing protein 11 [Caerostris extrusa]